MDSGISQNKTKTTQYFLEVKLPRGALAFGTPWWKKNIWKLLLATNCREWQVHSKCPNPIVYSCLLSSLPFTFKVQLNMAVLCAKSTGLGVRRPWFIWRYCLHLEFNPFGSHCCHLLNVRVWQLDLQDSSNSKFLRFKDVIVIPPTVCPGLGARRASCEGTTPAVQIC